MLYLVVSGCHRHVVPVLSAFYFNWGLFAISYTIFFSGNEHEQWMWVFGVKMLKSMDEYDLYKLRKHIQVKETQAQRHSRDEHHM